MATFQAQVEGLTGLSIGTSPSTTELTDFLKDGVIDVTNRCIQAKPQNKDLFMNVTGIQVSQGANIDAADIISVVRADGVTSGAFRSCRKISPSLQSRVTDTESLHFASKFNPVYMINADGTVHVFPAPSDNSGKDSYKVYYVNNTPLDGSGTALTFADSTLGYFPADKVYLVVIYAGIKSLENAMSAKSIPAIAGDATELTSVDDLDTDNTIDVHADQIEIDQWWSTVGHLIEGEEDTELAGAQLQKISAYINAYQAQLQGNTTDYQWMQGRHQILSQQYMSAFASMAPPQPQQAAGGRR